MKKRLLTLVTAFMLGMTLAQVPVFADENKIVQSGSLDITGFQAFLCLDLIITTYLKNLPTVCK